MAVSSVTHQNAKSTTVHHTSRRWYLEISFDHRTIYLWWSSVGGGLDRCKPVLSAAGGI